MEPLAILIVALGTLAFCFFSKRLEGSLITLPIIFTAFGWLLGNGGLGILNLHMHNEIIQVLAEVTLILVLFTDASRINLKLLLSDYKIPLRMLLIGMPLTILCGTLLAHWVSPEAPWALALLVAAILTPTDAALGQSVVSSSAVPLRIRQAINVESGLNDGIALPVVMIAAVLSAAALNIEVEGAPDNLILFTLLQVTLGPIIGIAVGYAGAKIIDLSISKGWIGTSFQGIAFLCIAATAYILAEEVGGNGFISAFVSGLVFGATLKSQSKFLPEFMESEVQLLTLVTFLIFGAIMLPLAIDHATWKTVVLALLYLTVIRMLPIFLSLPGMGLKLADKLFLGWFGPRGLASILFVLLVLERFPIPGGEEISACVTLTVVFSILAHGLSSAPLAKWYGRSQPANQSKEEPTSDSVTPSK
jgi:NhaP-type Na+/H+ or K+/H+ antiporter